MTIMYKKTAVSVITAIFLLVLSLVQFSSVKIFNIGISAPVLSLGLTVAVAYYLGEMYGFVWGLISGMCTDALSSSQICFSTITLTLIGLVGGLIITHYFNRNFAALSVLSIIASIGYFLADLIVHMIFSGDDILAYIGMYSLPSFIYTAVFGIIITIVYGFAIRKSRIN